MAAKQKMNGGQLQLAAWMSEFNPMGEEAYKTVLRGCAANMRREG